MLIFLLGTAALVLANIFTDHEAQREGLNELGTGQRIGT